MSGWLTGSLSSIGGKLTEITREVLNETHGKSEDEKPSASASRPDQHQLQLELDQAKAEIAALKEQNADLSQQLELSDVQVQQLTDKYKSLVERKLEHETVRRGGLSVSSLDSDGGWEYENRQLKDQITTLQCEVAHWKEVLKAQEVTLQSSQNAAKNHTQLELEITRLRREIVDQAERHQTELLALQDDLSRQRNDDDFKPTALLQESSQEWGNWGSEQTSESLEELKDRIRVLEEENKTLTAAIEDLDGEHQSAITLLVEAKTAVVSQYKEALAQLAEARDAYDLLVQSNAGNGVETESSSVTLIDESNDIHQLSAKNLELIEENRSLSLKLEQLTNENRELNEAYQDMNEKLEKRQTETIDATTSNRELSRKLENLKGDLVEYEEKYEKCKQENQRAMRQLENLTSEFDRLKNDVSSARLSNESGTKYFHVSDETTQDEITRLTDDLQDSLGKREKLVEDLQEFQEMSEHFHSQLQRLKAENKTLSEANQELMRQLDALGSFKDVFNETEEELQLLRISLKNFQLEYLKKEKQLREELQESMEENSRLRSLNKDLKADTAQGVPGTPANTTTMTPAEAEDDRSTLIETLNMTEKALSEQRSHTASLYNQLETKTHDYDELESQLKEAMLNRRQSGDQVDISSVPESDSHGRCVHLDREAAIAALNERNRALQQELDDLRHREMRQGSTIAVLRQQSQEQSSQTSGLAQLIDAYRKHVGPETTRQIEAIPHHLVAQLTPGGVHRPKAIGYHCVPEDVAGGSETGSSGEFVGSRGNESPRSDPEGWNQDIEWPNSNGSEPSGDPNGRGEDLLVEGSEAILSESCQHEDYLQQVVLGGPMSADLQPLAAVAPLLADSEEETALRENLETVKTQLNDLTTAHTVAEERVVRMQAELKEALTALTEKTEECARLQGDLCHQTRTIAEKDEVLHQAYDELKSLELNLEVKVRESERSREELVSLRNELESVRGRSESEAIVDPSQLEQLRSQLLKVEKERDDLVIANYELTSLRQQVDAAATDWKALVAAQNELSALRQQFDDLVVERDSLVLEVDRATAKELETRRQAAESENSLRNDYEHTLNRLKEQLATEKEKQTEESQIVAKLQEETRLSVALAQEKQMQFDAQSAQLEQLKTELNELRMLHQSTVAAQEKEKSDRSAKLETSEAERQQLLVYLNQKHDESLQYYQEMQRLAGLLASSEAQVVHLQGQIVGMEESLQTKSAEAVEHSAKQTEELMSQIKELKAEVEEKSSTLQTLEDRCQQLKDKLDAKESLVKQLGAEISAKDQQMAAMAEQGSSEVQQQLSLASQLKSRAVAELEKERERNGALVQQIKVVEDREVRINRELERLRAHLLQVEENYTKELTQAENRCQYLQGQLVTAEDKLSNTTESAKGLSGRLQSENADLKIQLQSLAAQRDSLTLQVSGQQEELSRTSKSLANLQQVLQHFQQEKDGRAFDEVEKYKKEMKQLEAERSRNQAKISELEVELEAMSEEIQSVLSFKQQLRAKDDLLERMRQQAEEADLKNSELQAKLSEQKKVTDSKIEKDLIKSLLLGYFQAPANKKTEVAHLLGSVLGFSSDEFKKLDGSSSSGWLNFLRAGSGGTEGSTQSRSEEQSITQQFVKFLETESTPKPAAHSLATGDHRFPTLNPPSSAPQTYSIADHLVVTPTRYQPAQPSISGAPPVSHFHIYEGSTAASRSSTPGGITFTAPSHIHSEAAASYTVADMSTEAADPLLINLARPTAVGTTTTSASLLLTAPPVESIAGVSLSAGSTKKTSADILKNVMQSANY